MSLYWLFRSRMRPVFCDSVVDSCSRSFSTSSGWINSYRLVPYQSFWKNQNVYIWMYNRGNVIHYKISDFAIVPTPGGTAFSKRWPQIIKELHFKVTWSERHQCVWVIMADIDVGSLLKAEKGMIFSIEWKRSFWALKSFKIGYKGLPSNIPFFLRNLCGQPLLILFSLMGRTSHVWKTASFLSSCLPGFFYSPRSYMINILEINCGILLELCYDTWWWILVLNMKLQ